MRAYRLSTQWLNISQLAEDAVNEYAGRGSRNAAIDADIAPGIDVQGEHLLVQMLISNLLDNAVKYSGKESRMTNSWMEKTANSSYRYRTKALASPTRKKESV